MTEVRKWGALHIEAAPITAIVTIRAFFMMRLSGSIHSVVAIARRPQECILMPVRVDRRRDTYPVCSYRIINEASEGFFAVL